MTWEEFKTIMDCPEPLHADMKYAVQKAESFDSLLEILSHKWCGGNVIAWILINIKPDWEKGARALDSRSAAKVLLARPDIPVYDILLEKAATSPKVVSRIIHDFHPIEFLDLALAKCNDPDEIKHWFQYMNENQRKLALERLGTSPRVAYELIMEGVESNVLLELALEEPYYALQLLSQEIPEKYKERAKRAIPDDFLEQAVRNKRDAYDPDMVYAAHKLILERFGSIERGG